MRLQNKIGLSIKNFN